MKSPNNEGDGVPIGHPLSSNESSSSGTGYIQLSPGQWSPWKFTNHPS